MSAATIDRRPPETHAPGAQGPSWHQPGSLLKAQNLIRTWADWYEQAPGFPRDPPGRSRRRQLAREFAQTFTATDIFTGQNRN